MGKFKKVGSRLAESRFEKHLHACIVASHVVNRARNACCSQSPTWSGWFKVAADALQTCPGLLEIESQLKRAVRGKGAASEPQCTTKAGIQRLSLMCKIKKFCQCGKKRRRGVLEKMAHQTPSKKPATTTPHTFGNVPQKWSNKIKNPNKLQNALPENCSKTVDKRNSLSHVAS